MVHTRGGKAFSAPTGRGKDGYKRLKKEKKPKKRLDGEKNLKKRKKTSASDELPPAKRRRVQLNVTQTPDNPLIQSSIKRFVVIKKEVESPGEINVEDDEPIPRPPQTPEVDPLAVSPVKGITPLGPFKGTNTYPATEVENLLKKFERSLKAPGLLPKVVKTEVPESISKDSEDESQGGPELISKDSEDESQGGPELISKDSEDESEGSDEDCDDLLNDKDFRAGSDDEGNTSDSFSDMSGETVKVPFFSSAEKSAETIKSPSFPTPPGPEKTREGDTECSPDGDASIDSANEEATNKSPESPNLQQHLPYGNTGQRSVIRCCHPECSSADVYLQRIERHYFDKHTSHLPHETDDSGRRKRANDLIKKYQKPYAKVIGYTTEEAIKKCFSEYYYKREFLSNMRTFLILHGMVVKRPKREPQHKGARLPAASLEALCEANSNVDDDNPDEDLQETHTSQPTKEELGLLNHCSPDHPVLKLYIKHKSELTKGANDPERACKHMAAQLSKVIGFVEAMQQNEPSQDGWDVLRDEGAHKEMIRRLYLSDFKGAGRQNYRKAIQDLIKFCLPQMPSQRTYGRIRLDSTANMPTTADFEKSLAAISMLWTDFTEPIVPVAGRTNESPVDLSLVEDYFSDEKRIEEMSKHIETLSDFCDQPAMFEKRGTRYDPKVAVPFNAVTRYIACRLTTLCDRGGVPTTVTCEEFDNATRSRKKNIVWYTFSVQKHKNSKQGPLQVTVSKDTYNLLKKWRTFREELKSVGPQFANDEFIVGMNGNAVTKIYNDFNNWGSTQSNYKGSYSSRTMRQHVTSQAVQYHPERTVDIVNKKQNHKKETANKNYDLKTREAAVNNTVVLENVKLNDILTTEALKNLNWFAVKLGGKLPSRKDVQAIMIERCNSRKNLSCFELSRDRYDQIIEGVQRELRQLTIRYLVVKLSKEEASMEECVNFCKSQEKQIGFATSWEKTLKKNLEYYKNADMQKSRKEQD